MCKYNLLVCHACRPVEEDGTPVWRSVLGPSCSLSSLPERPGLSAYVGDSLADVPALLAADVGIVMGLSSRVRQVLELAGVRIESLIAGVCTSLAAMRARLDMPTTSHGI